MTPEELEEYQQEYNFIIEPEGRLARPVTGNTYFFDDKEFNTKYIGRVTNTGNGGITLILQEYVPDITIGKVINRRRNLVGKSRGRELLPDSIVHLDNDSLDRVDAYLIPDNENASEATTVTYGSDREDDINTDELDDQFSRITLSKRDRSNNYEPNKKRRQQGGKKSKKRKSRKVKRRKTNRRRY